MPYDFPLSVVTVSPERSSSAAGNSVGCVGSPTTVHTVVLVTRTVKMIPNSMQLSPTNRLMSWRQRPWAPRRYDTTATCRRSTVSRFASPPHVFLPLHNTRADPTRTEPNYRRWRVRLSSYYYYNKYKTHRTARSSIAFVARPESWHDVHGFPQPPTTIHERHNRWSQI